jgi:drug/metabolite transporter (DMT)-like permease
MQEAIGRARDQPGLERAGLFAMLLLVESLHYVFARLLLPHLPPMASSMYVLGVATVQVGIFAAVRGKLDWHPAARHFWFFAGIGFFIATSTLLNYIAVEYIDVGTASMLGKTGVIISLLFGVFWLRERLSRQQVVGAALAVAGATIVSYHPGDIMQFGSLLILTSTFLYALHTALVKRYGQQMDFTEFFFHRLMFTTVFLFVFAALGRQLVWPDGQTWLLLLLAGTVDVVISRALYYTTLRMFSMSVHTIILTLSPVVSIVISLFLFGTFPGLQELLGGALVLAGVFVVTRGRQ